jgi:hypothetical protein
MSFSNFADLVKYMADGDLIADKYGNDVRVSESGNARFKAISGTTLEGILTTAAQPSITSLGTLSTLTVSGDLFATLKTASQPNITSLGTLAGGLNISAGQTYKVNNVAVLGSSALGSVIVDSSLR